VPFPPPPPSRAHLRVQRVARSATLRVARIVSRSAGACPARASVSFGVVVCARRQARAGQPLDMMSHMRLRAREARSRPLRRPSDPTYLACANVMQPQRATRSLQHSRKQLAATLEKAARCNTRESSSPQTRRAACRCTRPAPRDAARGRRRCPRRRRLTSLPSTRSSGCEPQSRGAGGPRHAPCPCRPRLHRNAEP